MFSEIQNKAIQEKYEQLRKVKEGSLNPEELADCIIQRRVAWINENLEGMLKKYGALPPEDQAYRIIFLEHMKINPEDSIVTRVSPTMIKIHSYNFCPYLEACYLLGLDTRDICKRIGEPSIQRMAEMINPNLRFSRRYSTLRPFNPFFCEEYIELTSSTNSK